MIYITFLWSLACKCQLTGIFETLFILAVLSLLHVNTFNLNFIDRWIIYYSVTKGWKNTSGREQHFLLYGMIIKHSKSIHVLTRSDTLLFRYCPLQCQGLLTYHSIVLNMHYMWNQYDLSHTNLWLIYSLVQLIWSRAII